MRPKTVKLLSVEAVATVCQRSAQSHAVAMEGIRSMKSSWFFALLPQVTALLLAGCASFEPALHAPDLMRPRQPSAFQAQNGLEISVEEFASAHKSRQAFDADIASHGVLPILIRMENKGTETFKVQASRIRVDLEEAKLERLSGPEAANQAATSEYAGKALGWIVATGPFAILFWPVTIGGSVAHTQSVNNKIRQHFSRLELTDALLRPDQTAVGFVYFKLPDTGTRVDRLALTVEPLEEKSGQAMSYRFSLSILQLSARTSSQGANAEGGQK